MRLLNKQKGETIVEVLISMAVLGLILSASYGLANKSTLANRQSQERTEALNENSARLEQFKTYLEDSGNIPGGTFCVYQDNTGALKTTTSGFVGGIPANPDQDPLDSYPNQCKAGPDGRYNTSIRKNGETFIITTRWFQASGGGVDQLAIEYKAYESSELVWEDDFEPSPEPIELPPGDVDIDPLIFTIAGEDYTNCRYTPEQGYCLTGDSDYPGSVYFNCGYDGTIEGACGGTNNSPAVVSYRFNDAPSGTYDLVFTYFNRPKPDPNGTPPVNYGSYHIRVTTNNGLTKTANLPIESNQNSKNEHTYTLTGLNLSSNPTITITWNNDAWEPNNPNSSLTLFEHSGYGGKSLRITKDELILGDLGFNDLASSAKVSGGEAWEICEHASRDSRFPGRCLVLTGDDNRFSNDSFNDIASSARRINWDANFGLYSLTLEETAP